MVSVGEILAFLTGEGISFAYRGDTECTVEGYSSLKNYREHTVTWVQSREKGAGCRRPEEIALVVVQEGVSFPSENQIVTGESKRAFFALAEHFFQTESPLSGRIAESAYLSPSVRLGKNVTVGSGAVLDGEIQIGDNTVIGPNVTIMNRVSVGKNCVIQAGCVIGLDGYAFAEGRDRRRDMIRHHGGVLIEDDVWIGANTNVARGTIDDTVIRRNAKVDALIHIAHNVIVGENAAIVAHSTIMGSVEIGKDAYLSTSMIRDHVRVGEGSFVAMGAVVTEDVPDHVAVGGLPAKRMKIREESAWKRSSSTQLQR